MRTLFTFLSVVFAVTGLGGFLCAQDATHPEVGGFETQGSVTTGYRFTDVAGRQQKFKEFFGLRDGFRLYDVNVFGRAVDNQRFADTFSFFASGIGGEPFQGGQLRVAKNRLYDFRAAYRQSYFYWDRNDDTIQPTGLHGLTTNHDWATVRKIGSVDLGLYATTNLRLNFSYYRTNRDGLTFTTRTMDYAGSPSYWGSFARANPYVMEAPINETSNRFTGGFTYSFRSWNVSYRAGYQTYEEGLALDNLSTGQQSINIDDSRTASELLDHASWLEFRRLKTPISEFSYNGRTGRWQIRGGYIFYRYRGPVSLNASFDGTVRTSSSPAVFEPYSVSVVNRADVNEPNHIVDQGFSVDLSDTLKFHTDYRFSRFNVDSFGLSNSTTNGSPYSEEITFGWTDSMQILDAALEFAPGRQLLFRPGIRLMKRDVTVLEDGVAEEHSTRRSKIAWPLLSVYYTPSSKLTLRGDVQSITNGTPYTRISPRTNVSSRLMARIRPTDRISIENNLNTRTAKYETTDFRNTIRSNATTLTYTLNDKLAFSTGFTYDSYLATNSVTFIRPSPGSQAVWRDQTISRVWQAGIDAKPASKVRIQLSGNYVRTTGVSEISEEPPAYGPVRWPFVTGTVSYDFPRAGRLSIDLQRTYYIEEILQGDNFSANVLNIRWTKEF